MCLMNCHLKHRREQQRDTLDGMPEPTKALLNRLELVEAIWFKSGRQRGGLTGELPVVVCLSLCRWDVADGFE